MPVIGCHRRGDRSGRESVRAETELVKCRRAPKLLQVQRHVGMSETRWTGHSGKAKPALSTEKRVMLQCRNEQGRSWMQHIF
jgi:hypothetical protein